MADHPDGRAMRPKLKAAFARLTAAGIIAKMNFSITLTDGIAEIYEPGFRGYAFWHAQDHERLREAGAVLLAFGAFGDAPTDDAIAGIGREVVAALHAQGLHVEWNGSAHARIDVYLSAAALADKRRTEDARIAEDRAAAAALDLESLRARLVAAVEAMPRELRWVDEPELWDDAQRAAHLAGTTTLIVGLPMTRSPVISKGEISLRLHGAWQLWGASGNGRLANRRQGAVAVTLKNALKKQGVTARVEAGTVYVKV